MTCQEAVECVRLVLPVLLACLALLAVLVIVVADMQEYRPDVNTLLGFAFVNLGISRQ